MSVSNKDKKQSRKHPLVVGCLLLGIAAIPDAMIVPVLHDLTVVKFGVSQGEAHLFMAVNLFGAILAIGLMAMFKRRFSSSVMLIAAAIVSAFLMAGMAVSTSWGMILTFRCFEGGANLVLLAIPLRLIAGSGSKDRYGGRMGGGFTVMMVALAIGVGSGGAIGKAAAVNVLWVAMAIMIVLALIAVIVRRS